MPSSAGPGLLRSEFLMQERKKPVRLERYRGEADTRGVAQSISERRRHRIIRAFAHRFGAHRSQRVGSVGEIDLGTRHIGKLREMIVAESRVDHARSEE